MANETSQQRYARLHPDRIRAAQARYRAAHPERLKAGRARYNAAYKDQLRAKQLVYLYGITDAQHQNMLVAQGSVCAICREAPKGRDCFHVDHCHQTGRVRGILCGNCNRGLGNFQDSLVTLQRAVDYLGE